MRRIHYAGGSVITGDRTCKAVLRYARALGDAGKSDVVTFPIVESGGALAFAHFLIGPASQLFSVPLENTPDDPVDIALIKEMEQKTAALQPARPLWAEEMSDVPDIPEFDYDDL